MDLYNHPHNQKPNFRRRNIDLNCDLAQSFGVYKHSDEEALLPFVSSVNIACSGHAGDPPNIMKALWMAKERNLAIGAHVGYPDLPGFGRREMKLDEDEMNAYLCSQLGTIAGIAKNIGAEITHFRPHGALYYKCATDSIFAENLARTVARFSGWLTFVGPMGSYLNIIRDNIGLNIAAEVHLDRPYRKDGVLHKFGSERNVSYEFALAQARSLILQGKMIIEGGRRVKVTYDTIHLNMDRPYSLQLAKEVHNILNEKPSDLRDKAAIYDFELADLKSNASISNVWSER